MAKEKKIKYLHDGMYKDRYVRAYKEGRQSIIVQVWNIGRPQGEPDGDWELPSVLKLITAIEQAIIQTPASVSWEQLLGEQQHFTRQEVVKLLIMLRERLAQIVESTDTVGDYTGRDADGGSYWEESGAASLSSAADRVRSVEIPK